jgi:hypothetical protein
MAQVNWLVYVRAGLFLAKFVWLGADETAMHGCSPHSLVVIFQVWNGRCCTPTGSVNGGMN